MPHLNGPVDWAPTDQAPVDGTIVYGFFDAHTEDTGLIAHVRPVRRYKADGDWFCAVSGHNLGLRKPIMISERIPYPTRAQVREVLQKELDEQRADLVQRYPELKDSPMALVGPLRF